MAGKHIVFEPMPGKICVKVDDRHEITQGNLILLRDPNNSRIGEVVAIYEAFNYHVDRPEDLTEAYVQVGDMVIFGRHNGVEISVDREKVIVLKETEILTKVRIEDATESK